MENKNGQSSLSQDPYTFISPNRTVMKNQMTNSRQQLLTPLLPGIGSSSKSQSVIDKLPQVSIRSHLRTQLQMNGVNRDDRTRMSNAMSPLTDIVVTDPTLKQLEFNQSNQRLRAILNHENAKQEVHQSLQKNFSAENIIKGVPENLRKIAPAHWSSFLDDIEHELANVKNTVYDGAVSKGIKHGFG